MLIENDRFGCQPVEIRRFDPVIAIAADESCMKAIEADDERSSAHGRFRTWDLNWRRFCIHQNRYKSRKQASFFVDVYRNAACKASGSRCANCGCTPFSQMLPV